MGQHAGARWGLVIGGTAALACGLAALPALSRIDRRAMAAEAAAADGADAVDAAAPDAAPAHQPTPA